MGEIAVSFREGLNWLNMFFSSFHTNSQIMMQLFEETCNLEVAASIGSILKGRSMKVLLFVSVS